MPWPWTEKEHAFSCNKGGDKCPRRSERVDRFMSSDWKARLFGTRGSRSSLPRQDQLASGFDNDNDPGHEFSRQWWKNAFLRWDHKLWMHRWRDAECAIGMEFHAKWAHKQCRFNWETVSCSGNGVLIELGYCVSIIVEILGSDLYSYTNLFLSFEGNIFFEKEM